jgi:molybdopterin-guanine dinucleotide biosynthesis adapter protein
MVVLIAAVGVSGSGKTTTLEYLISKLSSEGYCISAIKHIHRESFTIDTEGTNTWRFSKAGSKITVAISPEEIAVIEKTNASLKSLDKVVKFLEGEEVDVIFIEGFKVEIAKNAQIFKIITAKNAEDLKATLKIAIPPILAVTGLIAKTPQTPNGIPVVNLPDEGPKLLAIIKSHLKPPKSKEPQEN